MEKNNGAAVAELVKPVSEHTTLSLPAYQGMKLDFVIGDDFEKTIIWIKNAHIYTFYHQASISFEFAASPCHARFTARVLDRASVPSAGDGVLFMYRVKMMAKIGNISNRLDLLLCETPLTDAPIIMCRQDAALFSGLAQGPG